MRNDADCLRPPAELLGEQHQRLAIDLRVIPLVHSVEIRGAFVIRLSRLPAVGFQKVRRRGQHIRHRVAQIDAAVAVEIDAVFDIGRRQKLRLADFAGKGADEVALGEIAALLSLSDKTISTYRARLMEKMGMRTNAELTHYAIQNKLVD